MENQENRKAIDDGLQIVMEVLRPEVVKALKASWKDDWYTQGIYYKLPPNDTQHLLRNGSDSELIEQLDEAKLFKTIEFNWSIFKQYLPSSFKAWGKEIIDARNRWAHRDSKGFSDAETARYLETMGLVCQQVDQEKEKTINGMVRKIRYGSEAGSIATTTVAAPVKVIIKKPVVANAEAVIGLKPWREIMAPHKDVAEGKYKNAEFAADLNEVVTGKAAFEYRDPVEFFSRTYITEGMEELLVKVLQRLTERGGDPVFQLKTSFGGGKTHSMLALYHLMSGRVSPDQNADLQKIVAKVGLSSFPRAKTAVIVGTALSPSSFKRPADMPGITINTVWGDIAYQLAKSTNDSSLYDIIKEDDRKGVSPGSSKLTELFDKAGSCMILMDEVVAYARKLYGAEKLPAGTYENFLTFVQELTEAVSASKNSVLIASLPESEIEVGGEIGQKTLDSIAHHFARKESIWKPVTSNEGFEIVRRRLFSPCPKDKEALKTAVCDAFFKMYNDNPEDFPVETRNAAYLERLKACYPIHPELFDRLYNEWATLEKFQKTRGVLRLMAAVINKQWVNGDSCYLIMPSTIPFDQSSVKDELLRYLPGEGWDAIVDSEVDGAKSEPALIEAKQVALGAGQSVRKTTRTLFLATAPSKGMNNRGISWPYILLGSMQVGDKLANYRDALSNLVNRLSFLYSASEHYWFDTRPTLRKMMESKANTLPDEEVYEELEARLRKYNRSSVFKGIHVCPTSSLDIPDDDSARLVILKPKASVDRAYQDGETKELVQKLLLTRGESPRSYRNMLIFAAADKGVIASLMMECKRYLAWKEIDRDKDAMTLDGSDKKMIESGLRASDQTVSDKLNSAYQWCFVPKNSLEGADRSLTLEMMTLPGADNFITRFENKLLSEDILSNKYSGGVLKLNLDKLLWKDKDYISVKDIWKCYCSYCYLPRLTEFSVLIGAIDNGADNSLFGIAQAVDEKGEYLSLSLGHSVLDLDRSYLLVKKDVAEKQLTKIDEPKTPEPEPQPVTPPNPFGVTIGPSVPTSGPFGPKKENVTQFYLTKTLDPVKYTKEFNAIMEEITAQLRTVKGAKISISIDVSADFEPNTVSTEIKRSVEENCKTLKIDDASFS